MAFPDAENAIVTEDKLCEYLLNPSHPVGGSKAAWFASIGYSRQNWQVLRDDLLAIATTCDNFIAKSSPYGTKYETVGELGTDPQRLRKIVAVKNCCRLDCRKELAAQTDYRISRSTS